MTLVTTYTEATLAGKRKYELYADRLVVKGTVSLSYEFERTFDLKKLSPDYVKLSVRPTVTWIALTMSILTGLASFELVHNFAISSQVVPGVLGIFSASALIVAIATVKKVEYARFCSENQGNALLDIARSGREKKQFGSFIQTVVNQIKHAQKMDQQPAATAS